jgi:hypothetical protein
MRFAASLIAAVLIALVTGVAPSPAQNEDAAKTAAASTVPACAVGKVDTKFPSYISDSVSELKVGVPALRGLELGENVAAQESEKVLNKSSAAIAAMLPKVPNLIAKEEVSEATLSLPYMVREGNQSNNDLGGPGQTLANTVTNDASDQPLREANNHEAQEAIQAKLKARKNRTLFSYRIQSNPDAASGPALREFRMNAKNEEVLTADTRPGHPRGVGFGSAWLLFEPASLKQFRFRYLGRQKLGRYETSVLVFAQISELVSRPWRVSVAENTCSYLMQGVVWIDQSTFQIVRLQTDLLTPLPEIHQEMLRSEIDLVRSGYRHVISRFGCRIALKLVGNWIIKLARSCISIRTITFLVALASC